MPDLEQKVHDEEIVLWDRRTYGRAGLKRMEITERAVLYPNHHRIVIFEHATGHEEEITMVRVPENIKDEQAAKEYLQEHGYSAH